jgi:hypothetical protein
MNNLLARVLRHLDDLFTMPAALGGYYRAMGHRAPR